MSGAQPQLKSWGGPRFGSQHRAGLGVSAGGGCPSRCENSDAKSCILVTTTLINGLPRTCISEQTTSMSKAKSLLKFQRFCYGAPMVVKSKKQSNGNYATIRAVKFLAFWKLRPRSWGTDTLLVPQPKSWGTSLARSLRLLRLWSVRVMNQHRATSHAAWNPTFNLGVKVIDNDLQLRDVHSLQQLTTELSHLTVDEAGNADHLTSFATTSPLTPAVISQSVDQTIIKVAPVTLPLQRPLNEIICQHNGGSVV